MDCQYTPPGEYVDMLSPQFVVPMFPPHVAVPVGTLGPESGFQEPVNGDVAVPVTTQRPLYVAPMFRMNPNGLQVFVAPTGHIVSVPRAGAVLSNP